jgi:uncharacterized protein YceH (UPF0502 family)
VEPLDEVEARALGCLVEKHLTTPQYYPLTMNALVNACNQTSNRFPVMRLDEGAVHTAVRSLRDKGFARAVHATGDRVTKYKHVLDEALELETASLALLGVLLLRGAQTPGELRARTERMVESSSVEDVERTLDQLAARAEPLVVKLARQPGQKEARYAHLLAGDVAAAVAAESSAAVDTVPYAPPPASAAPRRDDRVAALEAEVAALRSEVEHLRAAVDALRTRVPGGSSD